MRKLREPVNFFTHFIPALLTIPASWLLLQRCNSNTEFFAAYIYGVCAFILFSVSAIYHGFPVTENGIRFWQKFDHCSIYLMIAGSYTPTALLVFDGWLSWLVFAIAWAIAFVGCLLKIFNKLKNKTVSLFLYILMGCLIVPLLQKMAGTLPLPAIFWLLFGGFFYIGGTYFYAKDKPLHKYMHSHELWHLFVIGGAMSHFVYNFIYIFNIR